MTTIVTPDLLYHYTSAEALQGIATSATVWASAAQYLNDGQELNLALDLAKRMLDREAAQHANNSTAALLCYFREQVERLEFYRVCVFSLSEEGDLLSQWRAYCPPSGGYAIGFSFERLRHACDRQGFQLVQCCYSLSEQQTLIHDALQTFLQSLPVAIPAGAEELKAFAEERIQDFFAAISGVAPRIKHSSFAEEREWRVICFPRRHEKASRFRTARGLFVPYADIDIGGNRSEPVAERVVIGPMPHQKSAMRSLSSFLNMTTSFGASSVTMSQTPYRSW